MASTEPTGPEPRRVDASSAVSIGGAPVSYTAMMAALVAVMAFIPASIVVGGMGGGWPLHDVIHPLVGLLLGPIAGPIASVVGILIGNVIAPYTNLGPWAFLIGGMSAFAVGMVMHPTRALWFVPWLVVLALHVIYFFQAIGYGIGIPLFLSNVFMIDIALILIAVPAVREWAIRNIRSPDSKPKEFVALFTVFFFGSTAGIQANWVPAFATNPWPAEVWPVLVPIIAIERLAFSAVGALIAIGVLAALRRSTLPRASLAGY